MRRLKLRDAQRTAATPGVTKRDKWNLKLIKQENLAVQRKAKRGSVDKP